MNITNNISTAVYSTNGIRLLKLLIKKNISIHCVFASETDTEENISDIKNLCSLFSLKFKIMSRKEQIINLKAANSSKDTDFLLLLWWPHILKNKTINEFDFVINLHPSLLPYGKGKYGYFWSILNNEPFGASLHLVDEGIDTGEVLAQKEILPSPMDTGEDLYKKGLEACINLFDTEIEKILIELSTNKVNNSRPIYADAGSYKTKKDFTNFCTEAESKYFLIKDAIRYLRARTFENGSSYRFTLNNKIYECKIAINEVK